MMDCHIAILDGSLLFRQVWTKKGRAASVNLPFFMQAKLSAMLQMTSPCCFSLSLQARCQRPIFVDCWVFLMIKLHSTPWWLSRYVASEPSILFLGYQTSVGQILISAFAVGSPYSDWLHGNSPWIHSLLHFPRPWPSFFSTQPPWPRTIFDIVTSQSP